MLYRALCGPPQGDCMAYISVLWIPVGCTFYFGTCCCCGFGSARRYAERMAALPDATALPWQAPRDIEMERA